MAVETAPAANAAPVAASGAAPEAAATVTAPVRVDKVAAAKAKALAAFAKPAANDTAKVTETPAAAAPKPETAEVKGDQESIATIAKLSQESRALKARLAELETKAPTADKWARAEELVKAGKAHKALEVLGTDIDKAVQQHLADDPDATVQEAKDAAANELVALKKRLDERDRLDAERADREKQTEAQKTAAAEQQKLETRFNEVLKAGEATKWKNLSRLENPVPEVIGECQAAARLLMFGADPKKDDKGNFIPIREPFTDAEADKLIEAAFHTAEDRYAKLAKRLNGAPEPRGRALTESPSNRAPDERRSVSTIGSERAPTPTTEAKGRGKLTAREAQARALQRIAERDRGAT